eukprot:TRINITY_DN2340_c0_g3_i1.p1 TRINITY_DN2340_c0_g3~~TRINITY_DN2340_c0_g3_i1.p1  ORF type:complete len:511 (+),score=144.63 TRINITY_DN2340_c0_g3_i1:730-2262(+)
MFMCKLILGEEGTDHTWVDSMKYYVVKQREGHVQARPLYLVQFGEGASEIGQRLRTLGFYERDGNVSEELAAGQPGGKRPCRGRQGCRIVSDRTRHLWVGWLDPRLCTASDDEIREDVADYLHGYDISKVIPERNGARVGAYVLLAHSISSDQFSDVTRRKYQGQYWISVDDTQPDNPFKKDKPCPRLTGKSKYCRGWNIRGHRSWHEGCPYRHDAAIRPTAAAEYTLQDLPEGHAMYDKIVGDFKRSAPFHNGEPQIKAVQRVTNSTLEALYTSRARYGGAKYKTIVECSLWYGTAVADLPEVLQHGLQPPSDTRPSDRCPRSGGKGLCTTNCDNQCEFCTEPHKWARCHMYGLGVYLADMAQKAHRRVRPGPRGEHALLYCKTNLGNPYLIEDDLVAEDAMHDFIRCDDPAGALRNVAEDYDTEGGHNSYYIRGKGDGAQRGRAVRNGEYAVFHPARILPQFLVRYELRGPDRPPPGSAAPAGPSPAPKPDGAGAGRPRSPSQSSEPR